MKTDDKIEKQDTAECTHDFYLEKYNYDEKYHQKILDR